MLMKYFAKSFEKLCGVVAVIIILLSIAFGIIAGLYIADYIGFYNGFMRVLVVTGITIFNLFLGYVFDVLLFGFYAQIVEIRKSLQK